MFNEISSAALRMRRYWVLMVTAAVALSSLEVHAAAERWQTIADGFVQVRFAQVSDDICTWRIRNTGRTTLIRFDFSYTYTPVANPSVHLTKKDVLPFPLRPGGVVGGLAVYSANTHACPATLTEETLERGDPED